MAVAAAVWWTGAYKPLVDVLAHRKPKTEKAIAVAPPSVTVSRVTPADFVETVLVTGSLVPREEVLVAPEVEGLRILELRVDQGDRVKKGDVLAVLETTTLDAQLEQNAANLERATAAIAQAKSQIEEVEARLTEAEAQLDRAKPLSEQGYLSGSTLDSRTAAKRSLQALLISAQGGLKAAEAEKVQLEAARRELDWRRSRSDVRAPVDGIISRRSAHIGAIATAVGIAAGDPMFRIVQNGEIELNAEVEESHIRKVLPGQPVTITVADGNAVTGKVRLVSPEVDNSTRLGRVRVFIGADDRLRVGTFASGQIETARERGLAVPVSAVSTSGNQSNVLVLDGDTVRERAIQTGLTSGGLVEVRR
jgi:RND family efflux transporter MFP subunit